MSDDEEMEARTLTRKQLEKLDAATLDMWNRIGILLHDNPKTRKAEWELPKWMWPVIEKIQEVHP